MEERKKSGGQNLTHEQFMLKVFEKYQNKYDILDKYVDSQSKIRIKCPIHGIFSKTPNRFLFTLGCAKCTMDSKKIPLKEFIDRSKAKHGDKYCYLFEKFLGLSKIHDFQCKIHNINFKQRGQKHLVHEGCPKCKTRGINSRDINSLHELAKKQNGFLISDKYLGMNNHVKYEWKCTKEHKFKSTANNVVNGKWCPICKESKGEKSVNNYLSKIGLKFNIDYFRQFKFEDCKNKKPLAFDFWIPRFNLLIEYDGQQHFKEVTGSWIPNYGLEKIQFLDNIKNQYCKNKNIDLLRISYKEFNQVENILENYLKGKY